MSRKADFKASLEFARNYTDELLKKFETPKDLIHQVHPDTNHALWFAGHIANTDNYFIGLLAPDKAVEKQGYQELFGGGSKPCADLEHYPAPQEILAYLKERRQTLLGVLDALPEEDLDKETPEDAPDFVPTLAAVFRILSWHEGLHAGQASVVHRSLGRAPVLG